MLKDPLAYRVQLDRKPLPLLLGVSVHPIRVDVDVNMSDTSIRFVLESVVVTDHRIAIGSARNVCSEATRLSRMSHWLTRLT